MNDGSARSKCLSLILIKSHINKSIRGLILKCDKVKDYIKAIEEKFVSFDKELASILMNKLFVMKPHNSRSVYEHIIKIRDIAS
jgi:hypothetical protein